MNNTSNKVTSTPSGPFHKKKLVSDLVGAQMHLLVLCGFNMISAIWLMINTQLLNLFWLYGS